MLGKVLICATAASLISFSLAACGSSSGNHASIATPSSTSVVTTTASPGTDLTGLGATDAAWNAHHVEAKGLAPGSTYGAFVPSSRGGEYQWTHVSQAGRRITGFTYTMPEGTSEAAAKQEVMAQLPSDSTTTWFTVQQDRIGDSCGLWNLRSQILARVLGAPPVGDTNGDIGILLSTTGVDSQTYDPHNVNTAGAGIVAASTHENC